MAPPTLPTEVKRRRGTLRKDRTPEPSSVTLIDRAGLDVPPPPTLDVMGSAEWSHFLRTCPWLAVSDLTALRVLCELIDRREAFALELVGRTCPCGCDYTDMSQTSLMLMTSTGYAYINPAAVGLKQTEEQIAKWMSVLGLTPSSRGAIGVAEVKAASTLDKLAAKKAAMVASAERSPKPPGGRPATTPSSPSRPSRRATAEKSSSSSTATG